MDSSLYYNNYLQHNEILDSHSPECIKEGNQPLYDEMIKHLSFHN